MSWTLPPAPIRALIRTGAEIALAELDDWLAELGEAALRGPNMAAVAVDPVLAASARRTIRSNVVQWASANVRDPGARVPADVADDPVRAVRDLVRRGLTESSLDAYRVGQAVVLRRWSTIAFSLTSDPGELRELLDFAHRSIGAFIDDTVEAVFAQVHRERANLTSGTQAERREVVTLLLDGSRLPRRRAEARLGYRLSGEHVAAIVWSDDRTSGPDDLDRAAEALAGESRPLTVVADSATRWLWLPAMPDTSRVTVAPSVRIALGTPASGLDGFRRSHWEALTTQRMLARLSASRQIATHDEIELVSLVTREPERAERFVKRTLGDLEHAPADVLDAVRAYLAEECNASRAAARLFTHRNTVVRRLARADELLPIPLADNVLRVGVALEITRWTP
ncbi:DNA-binding transcriptional regulator, PucR family [Lentzea fradiae]|uniref:DNA-binding transcriptional regulator, PucR family n=1 Tax=Lentzea fradiae TaxID=200378 RepID=A0A1G7KGI3_9PSEU|nr:PucR family transcriptional regulator [Lentzea fradiae]SDF35939.1 DNA-binding transcriptional regulator, PucR family [Lentzea fradiae]